MQWLREHGRPWDASMCSAATAGGNLEVLKWLCEQDYPWRHGTACRAAARGGHLEMLMWLREQDCPWDASAVRAAAEEGHLEVLKWARDMTAHGLRVCVQ